MPKQHNIKIHEKGWSEIQSPRVLKLFCRCRKVVSFTLRTLYPRGKSLRYPLNRSLGETQNRSGRGVGARRQIRALPRKCSLPSSPWAVTSLSDVSRLLMTRKRSLPSSPWAVTSLSDVSRLLMTRKCSLPSSPWTVTSLSDVSRLLMTRKCSLPSIPWTVTSLSDVSRLLMTIMIIMMA
jgi:hypothetical protein